MPRLARQLADESCYHVLTRGNNRNSAFLFGAMNRNRPIGVGLLSLLHLACLLAGCAVSPLSITPALPTDQGTSSATQPSNISAELYVRHLYNGKASESGLVTRSFNKDIRKAFEAETTRFGIVGSVVDSKQPFHLVIEAAHLSDTQELQACLAVMSLLVIPSQTKYALMLNAELYEGGRVVRHYDIRADYDVIFQLFLLNPIHWKLPARGNQMAKEAFSTLFRQVREDLRTERQ